MADVSVGPYDPCMAAIPTNDEHPALAAVRASAAGKVKVARQPYAVTDWELKRYLEII